MFFDRTSFPSPVANVCVAALFEVVVGPLVIKISITQHGARGNTLSAGRNAVAGAQ
jgi:hypothetical protein